MIINLQENDAAYLVARMDPLIDEIIKRLEHPSRIYNPPLYFLMRFKEIDGWSQLVHNVEFDRKNYMFVTFSRSVFSNSADFLYNDSLWGLKNTYTQLKNFTEIPTLYFTGRGSAQSFTLAHSSDEAMENVI